MTDDDPYAPRPLAGWYYAGASASLLFMALGCAMYVLHVTTDPASLALDERAAFLAVPGWLTAVNAVAVWSGLFGAILLLMRRRIAEPVLLVSLVATIIWLGGLMAVPQLRASLSSSDLVVALVIAAIVWTIYWFARHSRQRGWLR